MALSIGVEVGSRIRVGTDRVYVKALTRPNLIVLSIRGKDIVVSEEARTEILPNVFVFAGLGTTGGVNRLAFEAPREIEIRREN